MPCTAAADRPGLLSRTLKRLRKVLWAMPLCIGCLNPDLVNQVSGNLYPTAPGENPFVLATFLNDSGATLDLTLTVDDGASAPHQLRFSGLAPQQRTEGILLPWPFLRVGIGDLDNPFSTVNSIRATVDGNLTVELPFGNLPLIAGTDFDRGDTILFRFVSDARSPTAITASIGVVDGETQQGPFARADTFTIVRSLLLLNGLGGTVGTPIP